MRLVATKRISIDASVVVAALVISVAWVIIGLIEPGGLSTVYPPEWVAFGIIVTIAGLVLIPICARENKGGFLAALVLGIIILVAEVTDLLSYITGSMPMPEGPLFNLIIIGGAVWLIIQIPIMIFLYRAYRLP